MILEVFSDLNGSKGVEAAPGGAAARGRAHLCHLQIPCGLQKTHHLWFLRVFGNLSGRDALLLSGKLCPKYLVLVGWQEAFVCISLGCDVGNHVSWSPTLYLKE